MHAITVSGDKQNPTLQWEVVPDPYVRHDEVTMLVEAAGVNRADLLQARGAYPPPPGITDILGLEVSGIVEGTGQRVCSLLPGGGYAEKAVTHPDMLLAIPDSWSFEQAAAVPEAWLTAFVNLFLEGALKEGESVLIHAGASGVGTAAIQLARDAGARVFTTAGTDEKASACAALGAEKAINYRRQDFPREVLDATNGKGVELILDCIGGSYLNQNIQALARLGRLVNIGLLGGSKAELNLGAVLMKRLRIIGSTLRSRQRNEQIAITKAFRDRFWGKLTEGQFQIVIDRTFPIVDAQEAHRHMAENRNTGKIILRNDIMAQR